MNHDFLRRASCGLFLSLAVAVALLPGCGGNRSETNPTSASTSTTATRKTGRATVTITWPKRDNTRLIPTAANSIRVDMVLGSVTVATQLVARPADGQVSTLTFSGLPVGALTAAARAFPSSDGSGVAQAQGTVPLTVADGQTAGFRIVMGNTVDHLALTPVTLTVGQTQALSVTALTAENYVVLTAPSKTTWASSDPSVTVDANGVATAVSVGASTITVTETESGKSTTGVITVQPVPTPTPTPTPTPASGPYPQFSPYDPAYPPIPGGLTLNGGSYVFQTATPVLTDLAETKTLATGVQSIQTFGLGRKKILYAVYNFEGDVNLSNVTITAPKAAGYVVLMSRGNIRMDHCTINYDALPLTNAPASVSGPEYLSGPGVPTDFASGAGFVSPGVGPGGGAAYSDDFADAVNKRMHLQGGSASYFIGTVLDPNGNAYPQQRYGGGALCVCTPKNLTINDSILTARGDHGDALRDDGTSSTTGGASGGAFIFFVNYYVEMLHTPIDVSGGDGANTTKSSPSNGGSGGIVGIFQGPHGSYTGSGGYHWDGGKGGTNSTTGAKGLDGGSGRLASGPFDGF